jgi:hypothetical protein
MMLKRWYQAAVVTMSAGLVIAVSAVTADSIQTYRQQNGLQPYSPPAWFLLGHFLAREKNPNYVFGPVRNFVQVMGGEATWLIEDLELKRLEQALKQGKTPEYTIYIEVVAPNRKPHPISSYPRRYLSCRHKRID